VPRYFSKPFLACYLGVRITGDKVHILKLILFFLILVTNGGASAMTFYDKADWHFTQQFPAERNEEQIYVHGGMFLKWAFDNEFLSGFIPEHFEQQLLQLKNREIKGSALIENLDGVLESGMFTEKGNAFISDYFNSKTDSYFHDYENTLAKGLPSYFFVEDSWANYDKLAKIIDNRLEVWIKSNANKPLKQDK